MFSIEIIQQCILTLAVSLLLVWLSRLPRYSLFFSSLLFLLLILGVNLIPILRGSSVVELLRGVVGDVSTASGALMLYIIARQFDFSEKPRPTLYWPEKLFLIGLGGALYLSTFGFIRFDLYHLGYLDSTILFIFSSLIFLLIICHRPLGYIWLLALISFYFRLQSSNNLWDYLFDPLLWLVLIISMLISLSNIFRKHKSPDDFIII